MFTLKVTVTGIVFASLLLMASGGCSPSVPPVGAAGPGFLTPVAGDATDTVLRIGDKFPAIETTDLEGNPVVLDRQLLGKRYTLVVFWSTWCGYCMLELPHEVQLAKKYESAGLRVIGINADDSREVAKAAAQEHDVPWLNLFEGPDRTISDQLGVRQWPVLLLLDAEGVVISSTQPLRAISAESLPDDSVQTINGLDWTLRELLDER